MSQSDADTYARYQRAQALLESGQQAEAAAELEQVLAAGGERPSVLELLGRVRYGLGDHAAAMEAFQRQATLEPTNAYAHFGLARSLERLQLLGQARRHLRLAAALSDRPAYGRHLRRLEARMAAEA